MHTWNPHPYLFGISKRFQERCNNPFEELLKPTCFNSISHETEELFLDVSIMNFVQQNLHNRFTDTIFPIITMLGENGFIWLFLILILLISKKHRRCGAMLLISLALTFFWGEIVLKPIIARPRPFMDHPGVPLLIPPPNGFSCPSNHASSSFSVATMLLFYHKKAGIASLILASLIAFSRVFLFVHYPSDVLAGALLGILCSVALYTGLRFLHKKHPEKYFL